MWLDEGNLVKDGIKTHWKQQYRLRHNWAQGQCAVSEIVVANRRPDPPLLVMISDQTVFTADSLCGLRAWTSKNERELIASSALTTGGHKTPQLPVSMALDPLVQPNLETVALGFEDGSFSIHAFRIKSRDFVTLYTHPASTNGMIVALAYSTPYLLTMTEDHLVSLYAFDPPVGESLSDPRLLYSLRSHNAWPPVSLSLRTSTSSMIAAIAYSLPTYLSGWTIGIQELRLSHEGQLLDSRLATAADEHSFTLSAYRSMSTPSSRSSSPFPSTSRETSFANSPDTSKPTSMSYAHPYLLVAHPDNTLSLYLVKSTASKLSISSGNRLWGHTSSISGAHVGLRGKAVSVSRVGNELRLWDLEGSIASSIQRRRPKHTDLSIRVQPSNHLPVGDDGVNPSLQQDGSLRFALSRGHDDATISRGWVGFDEQNVFVLRENGEGSQALVVYDFT